MLFIHMVSALLVGLVFRFYRAQSEPPHLRLSAPGNTAHIHPATVFTQSVRDSCGAVLNVCAFIVLFGVILRLLTLSGILGLLSKGLAALFSPLGLSYPWAKRLLGGFLELSNGWPPCRRETGLGGFPWPPFCWAGADSAFSARP